MTPEQTELKDCEGPQIVSLTPFGIQKLDAICHVLGGSRSENLEKAVNYLWAKTLSEAPGEYQEALIVKTISEGRKDEEPL